ncbi:autotransporter domain-containing protein [Gallibacterium trehalosifermentans]|uniref:Autotransporter domain-containing protein n=1 Tax=Gallibacterium trehalosifermentans TaxID=516935 RepID=A0ABV6H432_9PAST
MQSAYAGTVTKTDVEIPNEADRRTYSVFNDFRWNTRESSLWLKGGSITTDNATGNEIYTQVSNKWTDSIVLTGGHTFTMNNNSALHQDLQDIAIGFNGNIVEGWGSGRGNTIIADGSGTATLAINSGSQIKVKRNTLLYGGSTLTLDGGELTLARSNLYFKNLNNQTATLNLQNNAKLIIDITGVAVSSNTGNDNNTQWNILNKQDSNTKVVINIGDATLSVKNMASKYTFLFNKLTKDDQINLTGTFTVDVDQGKGVVFRDGTESNKTPNLVVFKGTGGITKTGGGTLVLTTDHEYTGTTTINEGTLSFGSCSTNSGPGNTHSCKLHNNTASMGGVAGNIVINENATLALDHGNRENTLHANNVISGSGNIIKYGTNKEIIIANSDEYTGAVDVKGGTLALGNGGETGNLGTASITLQSGATLEVNRSNEITVANKLSGAGNLTQVGSGTTIVNNTANDFTGTTAITGGTLQFDNAGAMGNATSAISTGTDATKKGTLKLNFADPATLTRQVTGTGNFEKAGAGKLILNGEHNYTGKTTVSGGQLELTTGSSISHTSDVLIDDNKTYTTDEVIPKLTVAGGTLTTTNNAGDYGDVVVDNGTLEITSGSATVGNIKTLDPHATDSDKATVTVAAGSTLTTNLVNGDTLFQDFNSTTNAAGEKGKDGITVDGTWNANVAADATVNQASTADVTGSGTFNKQGNGTLNLAAKNTFGSVNLEDGTLDVSANLTTDNLTVTGDALNVKSGTELTAKESAKINGGTVTVEPKGEGENAKAGSLKVGENGDKNLELNAGTLDVKGNLAAGNIIATEDPSNGKQAKVSIAKGADVTLTPSDDKPLFDGLNTKDGDESTKDIIDIAGKLTVNTTPNKTVTQNANAPFSGTGTLAKAGEGTLDLTAKGNKIGQVDVDNGTLNVKQGDLTSGTTNINKGTLAVDNGATLKNTGPLNVGNGDGNKDVKLDIKAGATATVDGALTVKSDGNLTNAGTLTAKDKLTVNGGDVDVTGGNLNAEKGIEVNNGTIDVEKGTTLTAGTQTTPADIKLNGGDLTVAGELNARNITSSDATDGDTNANVTIKPDATVNLKPADGDTLFDGFNTAKGDNIGVGGTLNVDVPAGGTVSQEPTAAISADKEGNKGTLNKNGEGELKLTAPENTLAATNVNDGKLTVAKNSKLNSENVTVGNKKTDTAGNDADSPDALVVEGEVVADNVSVEEGGALSVKEGAEVTAKESAKINGGSVTVDAKESDDENAKAGSLKVGENGDKALEVNKGSLTVNGDLTAANIMSDPSQAGADDNASITIGENGNLNLKPTDDTPLFNGLNIGDGDTIAINGNLNLDIDKDKSIALAPTAALSGTGALNKNGEGTLEVSNQNPAFTGATNVKSGKLAITNGGSLPNSAVTVEDNATLAVDENGAELGSLTVKPNGTVELKVTPEKTGKVRAKRATLDGTLNLDLQKIDDINDLDTALKHPLIEVTDADGRDGNFKEVNLLGEFAKENFTPKVTTDGNNVDISYSRKDKNGLTKIATDNAPRALGVAKVLDEILTNDPNGPFADLSRRNFENNADAQDALLSVLPSLSGASSQIVADSSKQLATLADNYQQCDAHENLDGDPLWVKPFHSQRQQHQYKGASGYYDESYGFGIGAERCYNGNRFGVMLGYVEDSAVSRESPSAQSVKSKTVQAGIYGNTPLAGDLALDYKAGVGYSKVDTERKFSFLSNTASASYGNKIAYAGLGLTLPSTLSDTVRLESYARLDYHLVRNNAYAEKGAGILNLHADAGSFETMTSEVGVKVKVQVAPNLLVGANANVGYNLMAEPASVRASFQGAKDKSFVTEGTQENCLSTGAGVSVDYKLSPLASLSVGYNVSSRKGSVEQTPSVSFKMVF